MPRHECMVNIRDGLAYVLCRSKCTKNKCITRRQVARTHPILRARAGSHPLHRHPDFPWEVISCIFLDRAGRRRSVSSFSTLFRGSFEAVLPFFWSSDVPRDYPGSVIRSLRSISSHTRRRGDRRGNSKGKLWLWYPTLLNRHSG